MCSFVDHMEKACKRMGYLMRVSIVVSLRWLFTISRELKI